MAANLRDRHKLHPNCSHSREQVGEYGIDRICPVGEMNRAKSGWHHDGGFNILDLVRAVDIKRNTDRYADTFDIDYE